MDHSARGEAWQQLLKTTLCQHLQCKPMTVLVGHDAGNPNSHEQVKDWLYDLGWEAPETFKYVRGDNFGEEA